MAALARRRMSAEMSAAMSAQPDAPVVPTPPPAPPARREPQPLRPVTVQMTMYFSPEGYLHHTRCRTRLHFRGVRAQIESDFFCLTCCEHVAVPHFAITQIPVETADSDRPATPTAVVRLLRNDVERRSSAG